MNGFVRSLAVYDDGGGEALYAGGDFTTAGATPASRVAKWDGSSWSPLGSGISALVYALAPFDGSGGESLYAGGQFTTAGGVPSGYFAEWSCVTEIFSDGFEFGDSSRWSSTVPLR